MQDIGNQMKKEGRAQYSDQRIILKDEHHTSFIVRFNTKNEAGKDVWEGAENSPQHVVPSFH